MRLGDIIKDCGTLEVKGSLDIGISAVVDDSRKVTPGALFVAVKGLGVDGHSFIGKAIEAGAAAVVYEDTAPTVPTIPEPVEGVEGVEGPVVRQAHQPEITFVKVSSSRHALAIIAANFHDNPSRKLSLVGITGTNGKTTTVTLLYNMFMAQGYNCGLLSTIANYVGRRRSETANTTASPLVINSLLAEMVDAGCEYCFMEVSSIGVEQERVAGLDFKVGIFSNLTHDHLDYHGTFAEYLRCKKLFFDNLGPKATAVINIDDRHGEVMTQNTKARVVTFSCRGMADHTCQVLEESFEGMLLRIDGREAWTRLVGKHNASNILAIYSAAMALGADPEETLVAISKLEPAPGRLEIIRGPRDLSFVIDYAHTPDALDNALRTLREVDRGKELVCLFGCGGDRDKTKRPEMAKVAEEYSDRIIVTSDNSRSERTEDILSDIKAGFSQKGLSRAVFIPDRKEAMRAALLFSSPGAVILLAGKGHETYQIIGQEKRHFDEREILDELFKTVETIDK